MQNIKADNTYFVTILKNNTKYTAYVSYTKQQINGQIILEGSIIGGQNFFAPQDTKAFDIKNVTNAGDTGYALNHGEMYALSLITSNAQASGMTKEDTYAAEIEFIRG